MIEISGLNQFYGGSHTLWDVDMAIRPGSRTCLMGRNGMGKTTLLKCAMGLLLQPKLLILDEPCEGIQPNIVHEIGDLILRLNQEQGLTVLIVDQKLPFVRRIATDFCILDKGRHVASGAIADLADETVRRHL